ncbi:MAG: Holliday junction branch migration protein RuvA [Acidobacteria bacterium]|nr:MAG: Holliday junction branch migration protein RuvA [Acidobacteriota bacterium]
MIARLSGTLVDKQPGAAVVDVAGVGYQVSIPLSTYYELGDPGSRVELHVQMQVREDAIALFGFHTRFEKEIFTRLIGVSGIGPRTALAVLSGLGGAELIESVRARNVDRLSSVPGIGRKTAERIVVDLADRLEALRPPGDLGQAVRAGDGDPTAADLRQDLVSALVNLGYNSRVAADTAIRVLKGAGAPAPPFQALLRETLRLLSR